MGAFIGSVFLFVIVGLPFFYLFNYSINKRIEENDRKQSLERRYNAVMSAELAHVSGLPVEKNLVVEFFYGRDTLVFLVGSRRFTLDMNKVVDIDSVYGSESNGQALAGAAAGKIAMGGTTGALIGMALTMRTHLIITYKHEGKILNIVLDGYKSGNFSEKVAKEFKETHPQRGAFMEL